MSRTIGCVAAILAATTSLATAQVSVPSSFRATTVVTGLAAAVAMSFAPDGRLFVCLQGGAVRVVKDGHLLDQPFVTVAVDDAGERGLLGIAFDPAFESNQFVYVHYTAPTTPRRNRLSRLTAMGDVALPGSEVVLVELEPLSATNHNGGAIAFGPDGNLYLAAGDNAVGSNAQTLGNRLGKILRLNADGSVPPDNPFYGVASGANRAIWALGLRNPFTFAFGENGDMFINDVGQSQFEEVNAGHAGANYGWPSSEGPTSEPGHTAPIYWYGHQPSIEPFGCAVTGGTVYPSDNDGYPLQYRGDYFFADLCGGFILRRSTKAGIVVSTFATGVAGPVDLDVGPDGHLYYLARGDGLVGRIEYVKPQLTALTPSAAPPVPAGTPVTWTATVAAGAAAPLEYQFWLHSSATGQWTATAYGPSNSFTFTPAQPATYSLQVWARNAGSSAAWESFVVSDPFTAGAGLLVVTALTPNQQLPLAAGAPVTWTAAVQGGEGPYVFQFWVYRAATSSWSIGQQYSASPSWTWTPPAQGDYSIQVWARSAGSTSAYDAWLGSDTIAIAAPKPIAPSLVASPALPVQSGSTIVWQASTTGGRQPTQYRFWLFTERTGNWTLEQDWGASSAWSWRPAEAGSYAVQVWIRSAGSTADVDAWTSSGTVEVLPSPVTAVSLAPLSLVPFAPGSTVAWKAEATGGYAPLEYKFWVYSDSRWRLLRDYSPVSSVALALATGDHALQVWIRPEGSSADYESWAGTGLFGVWEWPVQLQALTVNQTFPLPANTPITWTAHAVGGSRPLEYQFWLRRASTGLWTIAQLWSGVNTFRWIPQAGQSDTYTMQVWVRSGSSGSYEAWLPYGPFVIVP